MKNRDFARSFFPGLPRLFAFFLLGALVWAGPSACEKKPSLEGAAGSGEKGEKTLREQIEDLRGIGGEVEVPVKELAAGDISAELSITGELVPRKSVIVKPLMDGRIAFVRKIKVGDMVEEDELIARIDDRDIEDEIQQQERQIAISKETIRLDENELDQKRKDLEFDRELARDGFLNEAELRRSELALKRAEIGLTQSRMRLEQEENKLQRVLRQREKVPIKAPMSGMVVLASHLLSRGETTDLLSEEILSLEGTLVGTNAELFGIVSQDDYLAQCLANGKDKAKIRVGMKANLTVISHKAVEVGGEVIKIAQLQDKKSHAYKVWIQIDRVDSSFASGLFVRANIEMDRSEGNIVLAKEYVKERDNRSFVQVVKEGAIRDEWVQTGIVQGKKIEIVSGVSAGDLVVASDKVFTVGQRVKPVPVREE